MNEEFGMSAQPTMINHQNSMQDAAQTLRPLLHFARQTPLFEHMDDTVWNSLWMYATTHQVPAGEFVFRHGQRCDGVYILSQGSANLNLGETEGGKTLGSLEAGQSIGEAATFLNIAFALDCKAVTHTEWVILPKAKVQTALANDPSLSSRLLKAESALLRVFAMQTQVQMQKNAASRVAEYLLAQAAHHGHTQFRLKESKKDVAAKLGLAPETLSRTLRRLIDTGTIRLTGYHVELSNKAELMEIHSAS